MAQVNQFALEINYMMHHKDILKAKLNRKTLILRPLKTNSDNECLCICSSSSLLQSALNDLKNLLSHNGYPRGIITYNMNDVVIRSKPKDPITTVPKRDVFTVLPYLGLQSKFITKQLRSCIYKLYGCIT